MALSLVKSLEEKVFAWKGPISSWQLWKAALSKWVSLYFILILLPVSSRKGKNK